LCHILQPNIRKKNIIPLFKWARSGWLI